MYKPVEAEAKALRRYNPDVVLNAIARTSAWRRRDANSFSKALAKENLNYQVALRDFQLAFVAKLVLYFYDKPRLSTRQFSWKDLLQACRALIKHQEPSSYPIKSPEDGERFMIRIAYQQFPDFYGDNDTLARTRLLFSSCAKEVGLKTSFDIDKAYKEATGLSFDKNWDITMALFGLIVTSKKGIQPGPITVGSLKDNISGSDITRFVDMISLTPQEFIQKMKSPQYQIDPYETFNPSPLVNWPMIRLSGNRWVIPIVPYLFRRGTEQAFYDLIAYKDREFSGFFGQVFEEYTDRILTSLGSSYEIVPETQYYDNGQPHNTCDRIIIKDGDAVLIECKTKRLSLRTKFTADKELLRRDLTDIGKIDDTGNIVHAIRQLYRTEQAIRANCKGLEELNRKITGQIFPLVLVLDPYYFANSPYIKSIIKEELQKGDYRITDYSWQILDTRGFEPLCALSQQEDFINLVKQKFSSPELEVQEMKTFIDNYALANQINRNDLVHTIVSTELEAFWKEIESRYQVKFKD